MNFSSGRGPKKWVVVRREGKKRRDDERTNDKVEINSSRFSFFGVRTKSEAVGFDCTFCTKGEGAVL